MIILAIAVRDVYMQLMYVFVWCLCSVASYLAKLWAKRWNFEQNIEHNRLEKKELPERKIGEKKSKIGTSLVLLKMAFSLVIPLRPKLIPK